MEVSVRWSGQKRPASYLETDEKVWIILDSWNFEDKRRKAAYLSEMFQILFGVFNTVPDPEAFKYWPQKHI